MAVPVSWRTEGLDRRGLQQATEETMKLINAFELATKSDAAISALAGQCAQVQAAAGAPQEARQNARATVENIRREEDRRRWRRGP
jgi:hypothetical protein